MGKSVYDGSVAARALYDEADRTLGWSLTKVSFEGPEADLTQTKICQPALYVHGLATLALKAVDNPLEFGIVITNEDGSIERFLEKPTWGQVFSDTINTGIYVLEPEIFDFIPEGKSVDFSGESFPEALAAGKILAGQAVADHLNLSRMA